MPGKFNVLKLEAFESVDVDRPRGCSGRRVHAKERRNRFFWAWALE